jgi:hypothetical protein
LDKVLLSLGKLHRFADVGINLCNTIERTLEAVMPTAPDYLKGAEMLTSVLDAKLPEKGSGTYTAPVQLPIEQSRAMALSRVDVESFVQFKEQVPDNSTAVAEGFTQPAHVSLTQADVLKPLTRVPASVIKLIVDCSFGDNCNSVETPKPLSPIIFNSGDACTSGNGVAAFNTFNDWLGHHSITAKYWYGSCRHSKWNVGVWRGINSGSAASFTVCELRRRAATTVCSAVCACQQCSAAHCAVDGLTARRPLLDQQSNALHPYSQQVSHPSQAYVYNASDYTSLNLVYRLRGGSDFVDDHVVTLPTSQCREVLDTIISSNLTALVSAPYDGSPITITEEISSLTLAAAFRSCRQ